MYKIHMNITNNQRDEAYNTASKQDQYLYMSQNSELYLLKLAETYQLDAGNNVEKFIIIVGDVILGLRSRVDLPQILPAELGISDGQALQMTGDLIDFLDQPVIIDVASDIAEAEAMLKALPTSNGPSSESEQTHSSDQASILQNRVPVPPNPTPPKWGSD